MPHYDRHADVSAEQNALAAQDGGSLDEGAMNVAAEALREVEVEAVQSEGNIATEAKFETERLDSMNIDELRELAKELEVPNRATMTDKEELIAAIRQGLQ